MAPAAFGTLLLLQSDTCRKTKAAIKKSTESINATYLCFVNQGETETLRETSQLSGMVHHRRHCWPVIQIQLKTKQIKQTNKVRSET